MHLKLTDKQFKIITFTERMLHKNLMVLKNKIYNIDIDIHTHTHTRTHKHTHTHKDKESKHNIKDSHQITREEKIRGEKRSS